MRLEAYKPLPSETTFSRTFKTFAESNLAEHTHAALVKEHLGEHIIGHLHRDATVIHDREKTVAKAQANQRRKSGGLTEAFRCRRGLYFTYSLVNGQPSLI